MGTHAAALGLAAFVYWYARHRATDPRFSFGTGKVDALGGFASAVALGVVAAIMAVESVQRLVEPVAIRFDEALWVAVIGLVVNLVCAWMLLRHAPHGHVHGHAHDQGNGHGHDYHHDHGHDVARDDVGRGQHNFNLRGALIHVLADALTSVLAIVALVAGMLWGLTWMDPAMGIVGAALIAHWSYGLIKATGMLLLDRDVDPALSERVRAAIEHTGKDRVADIHIWRIGSRYLAGVVSVVSQEPRPPEYYKALVSRHAAIQHLTVEVNTCT
jgi:cation diffusion facilitator family transporter